MADFINPFHKGLAAARVAEKNRAEINDVFEELSFQAGLASQGAIEIVRKEFNEAGLESLLNPLARLINQKTYIGIAVKNKNHKDFSPREIARWTQDPDGYPCWIKTPDMDIACENKEALEKGLAALLSSPRTGEQLSIAMKHQPKDAPQP